MTMGTVTVFHVEDLHLKTKVTKTCLSLTNTYRGEASQQKPFVDTVQSLELVLTVNRYPSAFHMPVEGLRLGT